MNQPITHTTSPIVTSASTLGLVYKNGVMLASDTLASYGSMARYKDVRRLMPLNDNILIGGSGEYSDFQYITEKLKSNALERKCLEEEPETALEIWNYLRAVMYQRRSKMDPLWNEMVVAGFSSSKVPFLGVVDKIGTAYSDANYVATGFGSYLALPLMREQHRDDMEEGEARALLEDCMRILYYRDCRASNRIQIAKVEEDGKAVVSEPYELDTSWDLQENMNIGGI